MRAPPPRTTANRSTANRCARVVLAGSIVATLAACSGTQAVTTDAAVSTSTTGATGTSAPSGTSLPAGAASDPSGTAPGTADVATAGDSTTTVTTVVGGAPGAATTTTVKATTGPAVTTGPLPPGVQPTTPQPNSTNSTAPRATTTVANTTTTVGAPVLSVTTPGDDRTTLHCTNGIGSVKISWTSANATAVYIAPGDVSDASTAATKVAVPTAGDKPLSIPCSPPMLTVTATAPGQAPATKKVVWSGVMVM